MWPVKGSRNLVFLMALFFAYILVGAVIFQALEAKNEDFERIDMTITKENFKNKYNITDDDMKDFLKKIEEVIDHGFSEEWVKRWSLLGSVFFAGTVVTTIGYGHVTPCTVSGRIFCMIYALIGIPLTWLMLSTLAQQINDWIANFIRFIFERCLNRVPTKIGSICTCVSIMICTAMILIIATFAYYLEGWSFINGIYFGFITLTTIGFGDFVPLHPSPDRYPEEYPGRIVVFTITSIIYFTIGLAVVSSVLLSFRNAMEERYMDGFQIIKEQSDEETNNKSKLLLR